MNHDMGSLGWLCDEPDPQPQELADCLSLLEDTDRQVTAGHSAARLQELLAEIGHDIALDPARSRGHAPQPRARAAGSGADRSHDIQPKAGTAVSLRLLPGVPAYDESDLDTLLAGKATGIPAALSSVENSLSALRAAPSCRELSDEAAARAAFRAFAGTTPSTSHAEPTSLIAHTVAPPTADRRPIRPARRRHRRRTTWNTRRSGIALTGAVAAAVIIVAVTAMGGFPRSIGQLISYGRHPSGSTSPTAPGWKTPQGVLSTGGSRSVTPRPWVSGTPLTSPSATLRPSTLCRELFESSWQRTRTELSTISELSRLAGSPQMIFSYCLRYLDDSTEAPGTGTGNSR